MGHWPKKKKESKNKPDDAAPKKAAITSQNMRKPRRKYVSRRKMVAELNAIDKSQKKIKQMCTYNYVNDDGKTQKTETIKNNEYNLHKSKHAQSSKKLRKSNNVKSLMQQINSKVP